AATSANTFPVAGLTVLKVFPEAAGRKAPLMKAFDGNAIVSAIAAYSAAVRASCIVGSRGDLRNGPLQVCDDRLQAALLVGIESPQRRADRAGLQPGQFAAELDRLNELSAFEEIHQRQHGRHDPAALVEVLFDHAGLVERHMLARDEV